MSNEMRDWLEENKNDLCSSIACALTHDLSVCDKCKKCEGKNSVEIRLNLIGRLFTEMKIEERPDSE